MNHSKEKNTVGKVTITVVKQPDWYTRAVKKTITGLRGGYLEAAYWIGATESSLFNRLRHEGDQIFPIGWSVVLQNASDTKHIAHAVSKASGGVFVPMPVDIGEIENADINLRLLEAVELVSLYSAQVRNATEKGVVEHHDREAIDAKLYRIISKLQEHKVLLYRIFSIN